MPAAILRTLCVLILAATLTTAPASAAPPDDVMTLTLVRHGESTANVHEIVETTGPGSPLTYQGVIQAKAVASRLSRTGHPDGVYTSNLDRSQQTAGYLAQTLGEPAVVLPGLREIEAGEYEGKPADVAGPAVLGFVDKWLRGDLDAQIPGSINGHNVLDRFSDAVRTIYASGDRQPVAFSHGASIAFWTLMSVSNPQIDLMKTQPLPNIGYVVVQGNPTVGWRLLDWNGTKIA